MSDFIKDKRSYRVTKVIFRAVVNPSTTTIHTPAGNPHQKKKKNPSQIFFALFYCIKRQSTGATLKKSERRNVSHIGRFIYSPCLTFCSFSHKTSFYHRFQKTTNYTKSKHCSALRPTFLDSSRHFTSKSPFFDRKKNFCNVFNTKMPFLPLLSTTTMVDLHIAQSRAS